MRVNLIRVIGIGFLTVVGLTAIVPVSAQVHQPELSGVYSTVAIPPIRTSKKLKSTFMRLYVIENFNFQLFGRIDIYTSKKGEELAESIYWVGKPSVNGYRGKHEVKGYSFKTFKELSSPEIKWKGKPAEMSMPFGKVLKVNEGVQLEVLGFNGVYQKEETSVSEIYPQYEKYLISKISAFQNGSIISLKEYNTRSSRFAFRFRPEQMEDALTREELDVYYIANVSGMRELHSEYNSKEEYAKNRRIVVAYSENAFSTDWMSNKQRGADDDHEHILFNFPSLKRINLKAPGKEEAQLIFDIERVNGRYHSLSVDLESAPIDDLVGLRFKESEEAWKEERKAYLASVNSDSFFSKGRTQTKEAYKKEEVIRQRALAKGYAYKNYDYWLYKVPVALIGQENGHSYMKTLKTIFDGDFQDRNIDWPERGMYNAFVVYLSEMYPESLPENSQKQSFQKTTTNDSYNLYGLKLSSRSYTETTTVTVHPELRSKYMEFLTHESNSGRGVDKFGQVKSSRFASFQQGLVYRVLKDFKPGTAEFEQLFKNLIRYTSGQPSIQEAQIPLENKNFKVDMVKIEDPNNFLLQCMEDRGLLYGDYGHCDCVNRKATRLAKDELDMFKEKYQGQYYAFIFDYIHGGGCSK